MTKPIKIATIDVFRKRAINIQLFVFLFSLPFFFSISAYYSFSNSDFVFGISASLFLLSTFVFFVILNDSLSEELHLTISASRFYLNQFSDEEQKILSKIYCKPFIEILKHNKKKIRRTLIDRLGELEHTLYTREYIQSLKDAISKKPENGIYLTTLEELVKNYNYNLEHSKRKYKEINKELSKANISTFSTKKESPMKILEQE
jgi:hypothetical protein